jgi:uncharacterized protein YutE (UPF0331/DUF86 family)
MNDVVVNKVQSIHRCVRRAREEYALAGEDFAGDYTRQDAAILNITRGCEQAIDLANYVVRARKLGVPTTSAEAFDLLATSGVISHEMAESLKGMVGFRNVAVHQYRDLDMEIVEAVITSGLDDLIAFTDAVLTKLDHSID